MNMFKKNGGFTLVELIVVIAILAILAGVAVPAYSGYISKAQEANDYTALDSVKTAAVFALMEKYPEAVATKIVYEEGKVVASVNYSINGTAADTAYEANIDDYIDAITFKSDASKATWESTGDNANKWVLE